MNNTPNQPIVNHYMGIKGLRRADVDIPMTDYQVEEVIKCTQDFYYFQRNYLKIIHPDEGIIPFIPRDYQVRFLDSIINNRFTISMQSRQMGKSLSVSAYIAWFTLFNEHKRSAILANGEKMAKQILADVKVMIQNLPMWLQQGATEWNKKSITFENGSSVFCEGTTENSLRGDTANFVLMDEFAHIRSTVADEFFASAYPSVTAGTETKIVIVSTPKGLNHFYKMWDDAQNRRNNYNPILVGYLEHPDRDEEWAKKTIEDIGELRFAQEFNNDFRGSVNTLIAPHILNTLVYKTPIYSNDGLDIYEKPIDEHEYIVTVDVAHGKGLDYTVCSVMDTTEMPYKYVAKYRSNTITPMAIPDMIVNLCKQYNEAFVLIEINDIGALVAETLYNELEYENIFTVKSNKGMGQKLSYSMKRNNTKGVKTSTSTKRIGCANLKAMIENGKLIINDFDAIKEFSTFTFKQSARGGSYSADEGEHDDVVMSLVLFGWLVNDDVFSEMTDSETRRRILEQDIALIEESLTPIGFFSTNQVYGIGDDTIINNGTIWRK